MDPLDPPVCERFILGSETTTGGRRESAMRGGARKSQDEGPFGSRASSSTERPTPHGNERPHSAAVMVVWPWCVGIVDGPFRTERPAERRESYSRSNSTWLLSLCRSLFLYPRPPLRPLDPARPLAIPFAPPSFRHRSVSVALSSVLLLCRSPFDSTRLPHADARSFPRPLLLPLPQCRVVLLRFIFAVSVAPSLVSNWTWNLPLSLFLFPWRSDAVDTLSFSVRLHSPLFRSPFASLSLYHCLSFLL